MTTAGFLLSLVLSGQAPTPPPTLTIDNGTTVQLCGTCSSRRIRLAVTATGFVLQRGEQPFVAEVSSGNVRGQQWRSWIGASWEAIRGIPVALILDVSDSLDRAGTYDVVLLVRPSMPKLKLQVVQAAAQLELPDKLLIERTEWFPGQLWREDLPKLAVREMTGAAAVSRIGFANKQALQGAEGVSGRLVPLTVAAVARPGGESLLLADGVIVPAGQPAIIPYVLAGEFPRGTVTGVVRLIAPQLTQPAVLSYEVRTKLAAFWLLLAVAGGLFVGLLVRVWLAQKITLGEAQQQALAIDTVIGERLAQYDDTVKASIATAQQDMNAAARGSNAAHINEKVAALELAWKTALGLYESRYANGKAKLQQIEQLLSRPWKVPEPVAEALAEARRSEDAAASLVSRRKADVATSALDQLVVNLALDLRMRGLEWQSEAHSLARDLAAATEGLPEPVRLQFDDAVKQSPPGLSRITSQEIPPEIPKLATVLGDKEVELADYSVLLLSLQRRAEREWADYEATWKAISSLPHRAKLTALNQRYADFLKALASAPSAPAKLRGELPSLFTALQSAWADGTLSQLAPEAKERQQIEEAVKNRQFVTAGRLMAASVQGLAPALGERGAPQQEPAPWSSVILAERVGREFWHPRSQEEPRPAIPGLPRSVVERDLRHARFLQTFIVGGLMALWAFSFYARDFDGTVTGLLTPFFATFLLDVSVEGLKGQVRTR